MARLIREMRDELDECPYLEDRGASMDYKILVDVSADELELMLVRGWRRFGPSYFRPGCAACQECVPIRIPVARFSPSRSQRRARRACSDLEIAIGPPRVDEERLDLYHRWHAWRERERAWSPSSLDQETYGVEFAFPHPAGREIAYRHEGKLVGLALCDQTARCWSAAYFYFDPAYAKRSLGTANVVVQVAIARAQGIPHVYLGFRVLGCASLRYKAAFRPHELLVGRPGFDEEPCWVEPPPAVGSGEVED